MKPSRATLITAQIIGALILVSTSRAPSARAEVPTFCSGKTFGRCLQALLYARCGVYAQWNPFSGREAECGTGVRRLVEILRPEMPEGETNIIAFPHRIAPLLREPEAVRFLRAVPSGVEKALQKNRPFRLWDLAMVYTSGNEDRALEWIAVFFQDTQPNPVSVEYARTGNRFLNSAETQVWMDALDALNYARLREENNLSLIRTYPRIDTESLNAGFYHFYVAAHIARTLRKNHDVTLTMAGFTPFLMNLIYETNGIDVVRYANLPRLKRPLPLWDARPFSVKIHAYALADMYAGYLGALFGLGGNALVAEAEAFPEFSSTMAKDPRGKMLQLYRSFIPAKPKTPSPKESS